MNRKADIEVIVRNILPEQEKEVKKRIKSFIYDTTDVLVKSSKVPLQGYHVDIFWEK